MAGLHDIGLFHFWQAHGFAAGVNMNLLSLPDRSCPVKSEQPFCMLAVAIARPGRGNVRATLRESFWLPPVSPVLSTGTIAQHVSIFNEQFCTESKKRSHRQWMIGVLWVAFESSLRMTLHRSTV